MMLVLVFDLFMRMMYKIYIGTRRPRGQGLVYYLCHPAFAMTGALAWQVNHYLNKIIIFVFGGEIARGFPGFSPLVSVSRFLFSLPYNPWLKRGPDSSQQSIHQWHDIAIYDGDPKVFSYLYPISSIRVSCTQNHVVTCPFTQNQSLARDHEFAIWVLIVLHHFPPSNFHLYNMGY